jgi:Caspase domain
MLGWRTYSRTRRPAQAPVRSFESRRAIMVNWQAMAQKLALARGNVIDSRRARIIKDELLADGTIDQDEFGFLVALRREANLIDPALDDVIFEAITPKLLEDGGISAEKTQWLQTLLTAGGPVDEREKRFLKRLADSPTERAPEFIQWCASLGIQAAPDAKAAKADSAASDLQHEVAELLERTEGQGRWLRYAILGMVGLILVMGTVSAGLGYKLYVQYRDDVALVKKSREHARQLPRVVEHTIKSLKVNGGLARGLTLEDDTTACAFSTYWEIQLRPGDNRVEFEETNTLKTARGVKVWLTISPQVSKAGAAPPLPDCEISADFSGTQVSFDPLGPGKAITEEKSVTFKKVKNPVTMKIKSAGKTSVPVILKLYWTDDPASIRLFVLGVGVSKYKDQNLELKYAAKDAQDLTQVLDRQTAKLFQKRFCKQLLDEQATKENILKAISQIKEEANEHDLVILMFAGHGEIHTDTESFHFLPHDYDPARDLDMTGLSWDSLEARLKNMPCRIVIIMDTCHSGAIRLGHRSVGQATKEQVDEALREYTAIEARRGISLIAACTKNQAAREQTDWGHGALTWALLDTLQKQPGIISLEQLGHDAQHKVKELVGRGQDVLFEPGTIPTIRIPIAIGVSAEKPPS